MTDKTFNRTIFCLAVFAAVFVITDARASERARMNAMCVHEGAKRIAVEQNKSPEMARLIEFSQVGDEYIVSPIKTGGFKDTAYAVKEVGGRLVVRAEYTAGLSSYIKQAAARCPV